MTHYDLLGLPRTASAHEVRTAYRRLLRQCHPDLAAARGGDRAAELATALRRTHQLHVAHATLRDPVLRARYDEVLSWLPPVRRPQGDPAPASPGGGGHPALPRAPRPARELRAHRAYADATTVRGAAAAPLDVVL